MDPLVLALAVVVGGTLGALGGGGSILMVPLLVYVADLEPKAAIATSLVVVAATSAVAAIPHARAGRVRWRTAVTFGVAGMAGAFAGGRVGTSVSDTLLLLAFATMMIATSVAMLRGRGTPEATDGAHPVWRTLLDGVVVGLVTGLVGAGGGFLVVPALVLLGGLPMQQAVATSLVVIAMKSTAGLGGYLSGVELDWAAATQVSLAAVVGALVGARLVGRIPAERLRTSFGWFVLAMGVVVLVQELPVAVLSSPLTWIAAVVVLGAIVTVIRPYPRFTRSQTPPLPPHRSAA